MASTWQKGDVSEDLKENTGRLGGSVSSVSSFSSGHDLTTRELEPCIGFCADSSEPGAASDSVTPSLSLPLPNSCSVSVSLSKINNKKIFFK